MQSLTRSRTRVRAALLLVVLATALFLPTDVLAVTSGGWTNIGHGTTSTVPALNGKVETFYNVGNVLYVGGDFTNAGGLAAGDHIATWNGTKWAALGSGLGDAASAVYAIAVDPTTGLIFAAGSFQNAGGDAGADLIAVFNGTTWSHLPNVSLNGTVFALTIIGRYLYIAGGFSHQSLGTLADAIVRWNIDSHAEESITPATDSIGGTPAAVVPDGAGGLYLGGNFINAATIAQADFVAHWTGGTTWASLGSVPLNARVRALSMDAGNLYVGGEFTGAGGVAGADKVAKWSGSAWSAVGGATFFGTSAGVVVYGIWADHGSVVASGYFNNAGGNAKADGIAAFNGTSWTNVGSSASGSDGPVSLNTQMLCVRVVGATLYLGGLDNAIADSNLMAYAASFRFRQPDGQISSGGSFVGNNIYNATGKKQTKALTVHRTQTGTFNLAFGNDGLATDTVTVKGPGSAGGFTLKYLLGTTDITAQVVAGTYSTTLQSQSTTLGYKLQVTVGSGVAIGTTKSFVVTLTSAGAGAAKDAVKAKVTSS